MMSFVAQHHDFFKTMRITTTGSTGASLEAKLGLSIAHKVASGPLGGDHEIGAMITTHDVAAVFFFVDPLSAHPHESDICALTRICEVHNVLCATNSKTGSALVFALQNDPVCGSYLSVASAVEDSDIVDSYTGRIRPLRRRRRRSSPRSRW